MSGPLRLELTGGVPCWVEPSPLIPLVSVSVVLRSGAARDPVGKDGLARVTARAMRRGADGMNALAVDAAIDALGSELSPDVSASTMGLHGQVIKKNAAAFVDLAARILGAPTFAEDEVARLLRESRAELEEARDNDRGLAQVAFRRAVFGEAHPYGRGASGRISTLGAIGREDVVRFYREQFVRENLVLGFAGDVTEAEARALGERLLSALPSGVRPSNAIAEPETADDRRGRRLVFVDKPERTQTQILIGGLGTRADDPDHTALSAAVAVFGGTFTSRLMREVRSKRGWSYGASARIAIERARHAFTMWTFPAATDAAACIALELELLGKLVGAGVTARELSFIKNYLVRSHAFDVDTPTKRLHQALDTDLLGLPADYYSSYIDRVRAVDVDAANAAVARRLSLDDLVVVVVGTAGTTLAGVRDAIPSLARHDVVPYDRD